MDYHKISDDDDVSSDKISPSKEWIDPQIKEHAVGLSMDQAKEIIERLDSLGLRGASRKDKCISLLKERSTRNEGTSVAILYLCLQLKMREYLDDQNPPKSCRNPSRPTPP
jgi:hypothetical protein